ncbi:Rhs element Vgr protein [Yersinia rohdei]|uniref:type VI secretion system Vgr family protein n=1 Tax=Yersinia rohdei TaxID=29485 RepID=UPI0005E49DAE|nr:type VI secretion system tip protein VgrG [Yersinia rohdei]CNF22281.1 Rhs element Vgr protein [Yersinia rohdei]CQJ56846.1 Rhs element Vgr protein [Yersinia rohdei]
MNLINTLSDAAKSLSGSLNRYRLDVKGCDAYLDVESFSGQEGVSSGYRYKIDFTSADKDINAQAMLNRSTTLTMQTSGALIPNLAVSQVQKIVHGVVTNFTRLSGSVDEAHYQITIEPFFALLGNQKRSHRFFLNKSIPDVVEQILREHNFKGWEFEFNLKLDYPKREQINQIDESDRAFIERLLAEVGIFFTFTLQEDTQTEVLVLGDKQSCYQFGKTLPLGNPAGMNDNGVEAVWGLSLRHQVVQASVQAKDYNYREAQNSLVSARADMTRSDGNGITYGDVYQYQPRHLTRGDALTPAPESGNFWARLEHERYLAVQTQLRGSSTDTSLALLQVLTVQESCLPPTLPAVWQAPVVITGLRFSASRASSLQVNFTAVPYSETLCWRPALLPRPKVSGTMMARVTSAKSNDIYAWQDTSGLYRVKFDADQDDKTQGQESMPVRLAKPYGGDVYGIHFPLIQGTEVAIAFHDGDPDRPYIAHALHDSRHTDHVTEKNNTRNVIRTPAFNKLRMEDKRGEEHIKLSTEYGGKTQLNLGHNVDAQRNLRGEGAELRTDDWVAVRGGKGVFISADKQPSAGGEMLDMSEAISQLEAALSLARSLSQAVQTAQAHQGDIASQQQLNKSLNELSAAGILLHAPEGVGIVSPKAVRIASGGESVGVMSGHNTDISTGKSFTVAASDAVSLFAQGQGMKLFAGKGKIEVQAQSDAILATAQKDIEIRSAEGKVEISANSELVLTCGGAYIKLSGGNIELGCPGNILLKSANVQKMGAASLNVAPKVFPRGFGGSYAFTDEKTGEVLPFTRYQITTSAGDVYSGTTDIEGKTAKIYTTTPMPLTIDYPDESLDEQLRAIDESTGEPLVEYAYYAKSQDGQVYSGFTDAQGLTERMVTQGKSEITVLWGDEALARIEKDA